MASFVLLAIFAACNGSAQPPTAVPAVPTGAVASHVATALPTASPPPNTMEPTVAVTDTSTPMPSPTSTASPAPTPTNTKTVVPPSAVPECAEKTGRIQRGFFFSGVIGRDQAYRVYLPPCYDAGSSGEYPVLYLLHGIPYDDSHWDDLGVDEGANVGIARGTLPPLVIAMPGADNDGPYLTTSGGAGSYEAVFLDDFVPFIEANYRVARTASGRAIGGMSRGGVWSLEIAFRNPEKFAAAGGHSVALTVNNAPQVYDPLFLATDPSIRSLRIYLDTGRDDWVYPGMEELHAVLVRAGVAHDYSVFEGYHSDDYWSAHVDEYLAFYAAEW